LHRQIAPEVIASGFASTYNAIRDISFALSIRRGLFEAKPQIFENRANAWAHLTAKVS
jgi:hypothetical protein